MGWPGNSKRGTISPLKFFAPRPGYIAAVAAADSVGALHLRDERLGSPYWVFTPQQWPPTGARHTIADASLRPVCTDP